MHPLTETKLHRPIINQNIIHRSRLFQHLNNVIQQPLTLISAPAGYGKSTLVCDWLDQNDHAHVWLSLDEDDDSLMQFIVYLIATLQTRYPNFGGDLAAATRAPALPPEAVLARLLINELNAIGENYVVVLEDYHHIHDMRVHNLLEAVLRHPPPRLHLVLLTRMDPPLSIVRLRAQGNIIEIRASDLRFSVDETRHLLALQMEQAPTDTLVEAIVKRTDGWAVGLRLLALSILDGSELPPHFPQIQEYFALEVLMHVSEATRDFLFKTSILDRVCAPLANRLIGLPDAHPDSAVILNRLRQKNLFVTAIDSHQDWMRYQTAFQQSLMTLATQRLGEQTITALRIAALEWFEEQGLLEEAYHHALAVPDGDVACQFLIRNRHTLLDHGRWQQLEHWVNRIPQATVDTYPALLITQAMIANHRGRWQHVEDMLQRAETALATYPDSSNTRALRGEISLLHGALVAWHGDGQRVITLGQQAVEAVPEAWRFAHIAAHTVLASGWRMIGDGKRAHTLLYELYEQQAARSHTTQAELLLFVMCFGYWQEYDLHALKANATVLLKLGQERNRPENELTAHYFLGCVAYHQNRLTDAQHHLEQAISAPYIMQTYYYVQAVCALAYTYRASDKVERALVILDEANRLLLEMKNRNLLNILRACRIEIILTGATQNQIGLWLKRLPQTPFRTNRGFYDPVFTRLKLLLLQNTADSRAEAQTLLATLDELDQRYRNIRDRVLLMMTRAWLDKLDDNRETACHSLHRALEFAEPAGAIRPFVSMAGAIGDLLLMLQQKQIKHAFIKDILAAITAAPLSSVPASVVEALSEREIEVLHLLSDRLSNAEIGQRLYISHGTVKQHTHRIYRKLGVKSRDQAVIMARSLKLI